MRVRRIGESSSIATFHEGDGFAGDAVDKGLPVARRDATFGSRQKNTAESLFAAVAGSRKGLNLEAAFGRFPEISPTSELEVYEGAGGADGR